MQSNAALVQDSPAVSSDVWSEWLLKRRQAGDETYHQDVKKAVNRFVDKVISGIEFKPGMTLVDIGSGEGVVPFEAIRRWGSDFNVVLTDISAPMLSHAKELATELGIVNQCSFVECSADRLAGIADASADVVTTRASLAYVAHKAEAFREIFRILKPGGQLSFVEPVFADESLVAQQLRRQVELLPDTEEHLLLRLLARCKAAQFPDTELERQRNPLTNYSERDLYTFVQMAGFQDIHLEFHIDSEPSTITDWQVLLEGAPHPWSPTYAEILDTQFTPAERSFFEQAVRPILTSESNLVTERNAYVTAIKPRS